MMKNNCFRKREETAMYSDQHNVNQEIGTYLK
jgi:hypothetical protein